MNRRSIARGVALGLFAGFVLPIGQIVLAALLAMTVRANVIIAAGATLITNPFTFPPIYFAAYTLGSHVTGIGKVPSDMAGSDDLMSWIHQIGTPTAAGLILFAAVFSTLGYMAVHILWRWRLSNRWKRRLALRRERRRHMTPG